MPASDFKDHLSRISTMWTMMAQAHGDGTEIINVAQNSLMERYSTAVYRYLLSILRDRDAADEVFQEFALRFVRGGFHLADREKGRFRDYVKVTIIRMASDYRKSRYRRDRTASADALDIADEAEQPESVLDQQLRETCREELLDRTWAALKTIDEQTKQPLFAALDFRSKSPDATSEQMAEALTAQLQLETPLTATGIRKTLQRAREKFAELLLQEVISSVGGDHDDAVEQELIDLGLQQYCRSALQRRDG